MSKFRNMISKTKRDADLKTQTKHSASVSQILNNLQESSDLKISKEQSITATRDRSLVRKLNPEDLNAGRKSLLLDQCSSSQLMSNRSKRAPRTNSLPINHLASIKEKTKGRERGSPHKLIPKASLDTKESSAQKWRLAKQTSEPDYYEVLYNGKPKVITIRKEPFGNPFSPGLVEGRARRNLFVPGRAPLRDQDQFEKEKQDDLITMHANEEFMESLNMTIKSCLEIATSVSTNLKLAAQMLKWNKFHFQALIISFLDQIGSNLSITGFLDFMASREALEGSPRLSVSYFLANILAFGSPSLETIETILRGCIEDQKPSLEQVEKLLSTIEVGKNIKSGVFMEMKKFDMILAGYVMKRRERNLQDEAHNIARHIRLVRERDENRRFVMDSEFNMKASQLMSTDLSLIVNKTRHIDILRSMEEAVKYGEVECEVPEGYIRIHRSGRNALNQVSSLIQSKAMARKPKILIPKEAIINNKHPMYWH